MTYTKPRLALFIYFAIAVSVSACTSTVEPSPIGNVTADGLVKVKDSREIVVFAKPDVDLSAYSKIRIVDCAIALRDSWQRDESSRLNKADQISDADVERFISEMVKLFRSEFTERLSGNDNVDVVEVSGINTLIMRPAIFDLDIPAGEYRGISRSRRLSPTTGTGTLFIEFNDSVTGELLLRMVSQKKAGWPGAYLPTEFASNFNMFKEMLDSWSATVSSELDDAYAK